MAELNREEALAFIESMRLTIAGRDGFHWMETKLSDLAVYVDGLAAENERLNAFLDSEGRRADFGVFDASRGHSGTGAPPE